MVKLSPSGLIAVYVSPKYFNKYPEKSNTLDEYVFQIITGKYLQRLVPIHALIFLLFCIFWIQKLPFFNLTREYQLKQGNLDSKLSP